jgi:hypothetical protein
MSNALREGSRRSLQPHAVLSVAKHDEGVYRLHSLTRRQHHQRIDVQLCQVSFKVHGEVRHARQGILERLEVCRWPSAKTLEVQISEFPTGDFGSNRQAVSV